VAKWEPLRLVKKGSDKKMRSKLIKMYWGEEEPNKPNLEVKNIVIHARRGDVADPSDKHYFTMGPGNWTIDFYREKIGKIRKMYPQAKITVLSEKLNSEDLSTIPGVSLDLGDVEDIQRHFKMMVTADLFMPADSSLSTWAAYLSEGKILVTEKTIKHFDFLKEPESWIRL